MRSPHMRAAEALRTAGFTAFADAVGKQQRTVAEAIDHVERCSHRRNDYGRRKADECLSVLRALAGEDRNR